MHVVARHLGFRTLLASAACIALTAALLTIESGCASKPQAAPVKPPKYATLPLKEVPAYLKYTILDHTDLIETEPKLISGFGVVAHLHNTADNTLIPQTVRGYIIREMVKRGFGSKLQPGYEDMQP